MTPDPSREGGLPPHLNELMLAISDYTSGDFLPGEEEEKAQILAKAQKAIGNLSPEERALLESHKESWPDLNPDGPSIPFVEMLKKYPELNPES